MYVGYISYQELIFKVEGMNHLIYI